MKKILHTIYTCLLWMGFVAFALSGCKDDELVRNNGEVVEGVPITVTMNLGGASAADVTVETRADNSLSKLSNLTIFVYDSDGKYQQTETWTKEELVSTSSTDDGVIYAVTFNTTSGAKKLLAMGNRGGGFWKTSGNVDASTLSFDELRKYLLALSYTEQDGDISTPIQIVSDEQMLMSGWNEGITFSTTGDVVDWGELDGTNNIAVKMKRAMAHITFNIPSPSTIKDVDGNRHTVTFVPTSYKVYNVPVNSLLANMNNDITPVPIENGGNADATNSVVNFNDFASTNIGAAEKGLYSFSFYMPENIYADVAINDYNDRDAWEGGTGLAASEKKWKNAPPTSTFVVISGSYTEVDANGSAIYTGNVQYTIHLGDFGEKSDLERNFGNFSIERNCSYTYNVSVEGVDNIVVEARKEGNGQNGAEGQIYSYEGTTYAYNLDAHYEQVYLEYNLSSIADAVRTAVQSTEGLSVDDAIANNLILVIQSEAMDYTANTTYYTTQNKRGILKPYKIYIDGLEGKVGASKDAVLKGEGSENNPSKGFDYKWVEMWPQGEETLADYPGVSTWSKEDLTGMNHDTYDVYGGTPTGDVSRLIDVYDAIVAMGKAVKVIYQNKYESGSITIKTGSINEDKIWIVNDNGSYKARFTAFVNEYYYYKHPLTGDKVTIWSVFVNKIPREMIIAMSSDVSLDGNSSVSQAYSYISQLSMQTPYSDRNDVVMSAFGLETYNETPLNWNSNNVFSDRAVNDYNLSSGDGRSNQLSWLSYYKDWKSYIENANNGYTVSNSTVHAEHKLPDAYNRKYYDNACMSRNRDLNGNGIIDDNEVRWYLASVNEYLRMGLAAQALSSASRLYIGEKSVMTYEGYPVDYISSGSLFYTSSKSTERVYWAVEKGAWGRVFGDKDPYDHQGMPIRCIRALPAVGTGESTDITDLDGVIPESFYTESTIGSGDYTNTVLKFKDRMVADMFRTRTDNPLNEHNENDPANRFSEGIIIARNNMSGIYSVTKINGISYKSTRWGNVTDLEKEDPCVGYSENGDGGAKWRVPNLNELVMMMRAGVNDINGITCCTQFSNSDVRLGYRVETPNINCNVAEYDTSNSYWNRVYNYSIRCVRDVPAGYFGN